MKFTRNYAERFTGALLGLAVGDALGAPVEFYERGRFSPLTDMVGGGKFQLEPGQWTDDTSMALCLADSLLECGFDAKDQISRYWKWGESGYNSSKAYAFGMGKQVSKALMRYRKSGCVYSAETDSSYSGNGSLMRLAPISIYYHDNLGECIKYAALSSKTTHASPECLASCELFSAILFLAFKGVNKDELLDMALEVVELPDTMRLIKGRDYLGKTANEIKGSGFVVESLEAALWAFYSTNNYRDAVLRAVNLGDDADTTGAICGQLAGAYYGESSIPANWLGQLYRRDNITNLAIRLANARMKSCK